jgi:cardiolipin synthase
VPPVLSRLFEHTSLKSRRPRKQTTPKNTKHTRGYKVLAVFALIALVLQTSLVLITLFEQPLAYQIADAGNEPLDSAEFLRVLTAVTWGSQSSGNRVQVLTNGEQFYRAELQAMKRARQFIHIECYIFQKGRVTDEIVQVLEERATNGVEVRLVIDAVGSTAYLDRRFDPLRRAGGRVAWYHPVRWYTWPRANNRTHRELTVIDGQVAFVGGAGFADQWRYADGRNPEWRDTMVQIEGGAVLGLQTTFTENWLEAAGEMLLAPKYFQPQTARGATEAVVVTSSPTQGRSSESRVLLQSLFAKARRNIHITSPYFLPDKNLRRELVRAVRERGVEVSIVVPGSKSDHFLTRRSSRALFGDLLRSGVRIFEYQPSMIHAKIALIDGLWAVVGSTNFDARSFVLNDEVNVAMRDPDVVKRLADDFTKDVEHSRPVSYAEWKGRPPWEKAQEWLGWLIESQQ